MYRISVIVIIPVITACIKAANNVSNNVASVVVKISKVLSQDADLGTHCYMRYNVGLITVW